MDFCNICIDPPRPLVCRVSGTVRLDAREGSRRLLGEMPLLGTVRLHAVQVEVGRRVWAEDGRALCAITVNNRSSLALTKVVVTGGCGGFLDGSVRVNGAPSLGTPAQGVEIPGLGPGCAAVVTWEELVEDSVDPEAIPVRVHYEYLFAGDRLTGETEAP